MLNKIIIVVLATFYFQFTLLFASEPIDLNGVWGGKVSTRHFQCEGERQNQIKTKISTITIDKHVGSRFQMVLSSGDLNSTGTGELKTDNGIKIPRISGSDGRRREQFSVLGRVRLNKITLEFIGFDINQAGERCLVRGSGTFFRAGTIIDNRPDLAEEQLSKITQSGRLMRQMSKTRTVTGRRIQNHRRGKQGKVQYNPQINAVSDGLTFEINDIAAGDGLAGMGVWGSYSRVNFENTFDLTQYKGNTNNYFIGLDVSLNDHFLIGLAAGYEDTNTRSKLNQGQEDIKGFSLSPYLAYNINETFSVDFIAGFNQTDNKQSRVNFSGEILKARVDGKNWFIAGNFSGFWDFEPFTISSFAGILAAASEDDTTLETNGRTISGDGTRLVQYNIGGELSYQIVDFEPYFNLLYNYDSYATKNEIFGDIQPENDDDDFLLSLGLRYYHKNGFSLVAEYGQRLKRADIKEKTFNLNARWDF